MADTPANVPPKGEVETLAAPAINAPVAASTVEAVWLLDLWSRVKEHKIAQWTLAYAAFAFVTLHAATLVSDALEWPHVLMRALALVLLLGLPMAPILAWYHGVRALKRVSIPELALIVPLLVITGTLLWRSLHPAAEQARTETTNPAVSEPVFAPPPHSIAVMPFVNMSGDAKQEYFSDGISEELLNSLSRLNNLQVAARTSSFSFKGQNVDVSTIAHKLNVGAILEGSVRRAGNTVRITVQLINGQSGFHLWSQTYDRNLSDILKVQTDVATSVAQQLEVKLIGDEAAKIEEGGTTNPEAYDADLRGEHLLSAESPETTYTAALAAFDQAIALDPNYAMAYAQRARALLDISYLNSQFSSRETIRRQARSAAERAVALAPGLANAHLAVATTRAWGSLDMASAAPEFDRALALGPGNARVERTYSNFAAQLGHFEQAMLSARRAVSLDPSGYWAHKDLGSTLLFARRFDDALAEFQIAKALSPSSHEIWALIAEDFLASGRVEQALQLCESTATPMGEDDRHSCLAFAYHALNRQADAQRELGQYRALDGDGGAYNLAGIYAYWGEKADALQWLSKAERLRDPGMTDLKVDWRLVPIRDEPQFKAIVARMNFPP